MDGDMWAGKPGRGQRGAGKREGRMGGREGADKRVTGSGEGRVREELTPHALLSHAAGR